MRGFLLITLTWIILLQTTNGEESPIPVYNETVHIFLLMVRHPDLNRIHRLRQDDEDGGNNGAPTLSFAETGQHIGQIIQGVFGGDLRPVFAGSLKFVEEPTAQQNLGNFLGTIAPAFNLILRDLYTRTQVAFGFATTPKPTTVSPQPSLIEYETEDNSTLINSNGTYIYDYDTNATATLAVVQPGQPKQQQTNQVILPNSPALPPAAPTTSWQYVLNQINEETTTVEPLPLIRITPASTLTDDDDEEGDSRVV